MQVEKCKLYTPWDTDCNEQDIAKTTQKQHEALHAMLTNKNHMILALKLLLPLYCKTKLLMNDNVQNIESKKVLKLLRIIHSSIIYLCCTSVEHNTTLPYTYTKHSRQNIESEKLLFSYWKIHTFCSPMGDLIVMPRNTTKEHKFS